ncbi:chloride channel protein [Microcoleus sp. FACHB-1515]|uniref:chloride channel protein n=1 Tax=Cyanophyceae TaxID=3028117 RepID=UPI0016867F40|nr:chloride channel protein [Microcoleus sp. FACHB-1515]MBD2089336.1 chloride channel protein [Microcoleus sp. FACHB-1515]
MTSTPAAKGLVSPEPVAPSNPASRLKHLLTRLQPSPESVVLLLAVLIGTGAGVGVVVFRALIHLIHNLMLGEVLSFLSVWGAWTLAFIPILGGLVICLLRWRIRDFGPGLSTLMEAVQSGREFLPLKPIAKMVAASISLGSGASLGPEGPSVEIGATFGLLLGQILQVSQERQRLLLGAGAAAGLAAGFNAPIAGVFFALEVVLGTTFATSAVSVVLLAAVVAAWIAQIGLGSQPAFALPAYEVRSLLELPLYVGLGVLASLVSRLYVQALRRSQQCFQGQVPAFAWLVRIPQPLHPVLGGLCLGIVALWLPQILGVGYETVESMLQDVQFSLSLVIALLVVKLIMTAVSYGSGFVGGIFAPALFLGASLGATYGKVLAIALPMLHPYMASPPAYAMVGMAAVLAGSVRAPLTAILLLFELTQDYRIVLPLMAAVGLSVWLVEWLEPVKRSEPSKSVVLPAGAIDPATELPESDSAELREPVRESVPPRPAPEPLPLRSDLHSAWDELPPLQVAAALQPLPLQVAGDATLASVGTALVEQRCHTAFVMADDRLVGLVTLHDVDRLLMRAKSEGETKALLETPIAQLCTTDILLAYPDELLSEAIARMATRGLHQLPIVTRESPNQAIGVLTQEGITLAQGLHRTGELLRSQLAVEADDLEEAIEPEAALL